MAIHVVLIRLLCSRNFVDRLFCEALRRVNVRVTERAYVDSGVLSESDGSEGEACGADCGEHHWLALHGAFLRA